MERRATIAVISNPDGISWPDCRDDQGNDIGGAVYEVRSAGTRQVETRRKLDYGDRLYHLTPDLRSVVRALQLSGHTFRLVGPSK